MLKVYISHLCCPLQFVRVPQQAVSLPQQTIYRRYSNSKNEPVTCDYLIEDCALPSWNVEAAERKTRIIKGCCYGKCDKPEKGLHINDCLCVQSSAFEPSTPCVTTCLEEDELVVWSSNPIDSRVLLVEHQIRCCVCDAALTVGTVINVVPATDCLKKGKDLNRTAPSPHEV